MRCADRWAKIGIALKGVEAHEVRHVGLTCQLAPGRRGIATLNICKRRSGLSDSRRTLRAGHCRMRQPATGKPARKAGAPREQGEGDQGPQRPKPAAS
jgi:hypothetical protein